MAQYETPLPTAPDPLPQRRARWPLAGVMALDLLLAILLVLIITTVVTGVLIGLRAAQQGTTLAELGQLGQAGVVRLLGADGLFLTLLIQNSIFALVPVLRVAVVRREPLAQIGFQARPALRLALFGVGLGVLVLLGNAAIGYFFNQLDIRQNQAAQYPLNPGDYAGQALFMVGAALLAPIGEEILFRGYVFNAIRQTFGARGWGLPLAYAASALLFSISHSLAATEGLIALLVPTFVMGLVLAWGMQRTGSLVPCIIAHAINNAVALLVLLTCVNNPGMTGCPTL